MGDTEVIHSLLSQMTLLSILLYLYEHFDRHVCPTNTALFGHSSVTEQWHLQSVEEVLIESGRGSLQCYLTLIWLHLNKL